jgi:hypothetical protein
VWELIEVRGGEFANVRARVESTLEQRDPPRETERELEGLQTHAPVPQRGLGGRQFIQSAFRIALRIRHIHIIEHLTQASKAFFGGSAAAAHPLETRERGKAHEIQPTR